MKAWVNDLNTTNFRIMVSTLTSAVLVLGVSVAILGFNWMPTEQQMRVLQGCAILLSVMMGFDVTQFIGKRFSDAGYAAAKNTGPTQVNVEPPSDVTVKGDAVVTDKTDPSIVSGPSRSVSPITRDD